tara:strand:+ start:733 stop:1383 length:651 start_codon:yes stop_codon:yes gene_type:complete
MDDLMRDSVSHFGHRYETRGAVTEASPAFKLEEELDRPALLLRPADSNDAAFIMETWLDGHAKQNKGQSVISLFKLHRPIVEDLLGESFTYVACNHGMTDQIYGYLCGRRYKFDIMGKQKSLLIMHWGHVKSAFRGFGIAGTIAERVFGYKRGQKVLHTHQGRIFKQLKKSHNLEYAPRCLTAEGIDAYLDHYVAERIKHYGGHRGRKINSASPRR